MRNITCIILALIILALALPSPVRADRIRLRSGKVIEGVLAAPGDQPGAAGRVRLWVGPSQITLPLAQIAAVTTDTLADNLLLEARFQFEGRRLEEGAEKMGLAVREGVAPEKITPLLLKYGDALTTAIPHLNLAAREGLSQALARLAGAPADAGALPAIGRLNLHIALGEEAPSRAILAALGPQYFTSHPAESARLSQALQRTLEAWAAAEDFAGGQSTIEMMRRIAPRQADDAAIQFYLQWGSVERHGGRYESALRIYSGAMMSLAPQIAIDRTTTTLMEMEKTAREKKQLLDVVGLYETYAKPICPRYASDRLALIWRDEGRMRMWDGRLPEARQALTQAEQYKKGAAARELAELEWRERRARLAPEDFKGHYELGQWCQGKELYEQALTELRTARQSPELAVDSGNRIETIRSKLAEVQLAAIMSLYEAGDYARVLEEEIPRFMRQDHPAGYLAQAKQLEDMARESITMLRAQRPQQAESLYRQAERALYADDFQKAKGLLETLTTYYRDTVTYPRASALAAVVEQKVAMAEMEAGRKPARAAAASSATLARASISSGTQARVTNMIDQQTSWSLAGVGNAPLRKAAPAGRKPPVKAQAARTTTTQPASPENRNVNKALNQLLQEGITNVQ